MENDGTGSSDIVAALSYFLSERDQTQALSERREHLAKILYAHWHPDNRLEDWDRQNVLIDRSRFRAMANVVTRFFDERFHLALKPKPE